MMAAAKGRWLGFPGDLASAKMGLRFMGMDGEWMGNGISLDYKAKRRGAALSKRGAAGRGGRGLWRASGLNLLKIDQADDDIRHGACLCRIDDAAKAIPVDDAPNSWGWELRLSKALAPIVRVVAKMSWHVMESDLIGRVGKAKAGARAQKGQGPGHGELAQSLMGAGAVLDAAEVQGESRHGGSSLGRKGAGGFNFASMGFKVRAKEHQGVPRSEGLGGLGSAGQVRPRDEGPLASLELGNDGGVGPALSRSEAAFGKGVPKVRVGGDEVEVDQSERHGAGE